MWKPYNEVEIYEYYIGQPLVLIKKYPSVFRNDGDIPSMAFYDFSGYIFWKDFGKFEENPAIGKKDVVGFVVQKENLSSRTEGENFIVQVLVPRILANKEAKGIVSPPEGFTTNSGVIRPKKKEKPVPSLSVRQNWRDYELEYWKFIDRSLLAKYDTYPTHSLTYTLDGVVSREMGSTPESPGFTYLYDSEVESWKAYKPLEKGADKWKSCNINSVIDGYKQLPNTGKTLVIVSSRKDMFTVLTYLDVCSISPTSEGSWGNILRKAKELNSRFSKIYIWLDADETGYMNTKKLAYKTNWIGIYPPMWYKENKIKDQTDMVVNGSPLFLQEFWDRNC